MKKIFTLVIMLVCSTSVFSQVIYYVKPAGNDANDGLSWATAFKTLQKATNTISTGEIWVAAGTYYPDEGIGQTDNNRGAYYTLKNAVAIYGGFPPSGSPEFNDRDWKTYPTILSGEIQQDGNNSNNSYHVVQCSKARPASILDGLTITGGNANGSWPQDEGGGMHISNYGGAYSALGPTIRNCTFSNNSARVGGAIYNYWSASPRISNCTFSNNTATDEGGAIYSYSQSSQVITNSIFLKNKASKGGAVFDNQIVSEAIINCSFFGNTATTGAAVASIVSSYLYIRNSIFWGSSNPVYTDKSLWSGISVAYSIVQGGFEGEGNLNTDPQFVNASAGDLHVKTCSPAVDAGTNAAVMPEMEFDFEGNDRVVNVVDMGAYESQGQIVYVKADATGSNNGTSWANAFKKLQNALAYLPPCANNVQIWVAKGTYYPDETSSTNTNDRSASFILKNNTAIYGGFTGNETKIWQRLPKFNVTILSGDINADNTLTGNSYHVVRSNAVNASAILDGFTITGGNADVAGNNKGGGMLNESSTALISNCRFEENYATEGAGMFNASASIILNDCVFSDNTGNYGTGIYNLTNAPVITNCEFRENTAANNGGGIYNYSASARMTNCLFWLNTGVSGGGIINFFSNGVVLTNCSFWGNMANEGGAIYNWVATPVIANSILWGDPGGEVKGDVASVSYSIVQGGYSGTNILTADPLFRSAPAGNLQLLAASPAIDAGNDAAVPKGIENDLFGGSRFVRRVDMGAYEYSVGTIPGPGSLKLYCPGNFTLYSDPGQCGTIGDFTGNHAATTDGGKGPVNINYSPASSTLLEVGQDTIWVTATDSIGQSMNCFFIVTVVDTIPPVLSCNRINGLMLVKSTDSAICTYTMKGKALDIEAIDNCSGRLIYAYTLSGATIIQRPVISTTLEGAVFNAGVTTIHWIVQDSSGNESNCDMNLRVVDRTAPLIKAVTVNKPVLYPPNHQMQDISVGYLVSDNCSLVTTTLSVTSNEDTNINGAGNTSTDWQVVDDHLVKLRAERSGTGSDRIYTITITTIDAVGNTSSATTTVTVPHDKAVTKNARVAATQDMTGLQVSAVPNPFTNGFTLTIKSPSTYTVNIRVLDAEGRLVDSRSNERSNSVLYLGEKYLPGVYYMQLIQGGEMKTIKLVKQPH